MATRWRMPPDSSLGYFVASRLTSSPTLRDPLPRPLAALGGRDAAALETERDVVLDGAVVERRVVLEHHAAIRARRADRLVGDQHRAPPSADGAGATRQSAGAPSTCRTRWPEDRDELPFVRQVLHGKRDIADHGQVAELLRDVIELHDVGK